MKTGIANLPLHFGNAPSWLFEKMAKLSREISIIFIKEHGVEEYLKKLADPFWFQSLGCILGFDWHSSGLTTVTCGALKEGLKPLQKDIGLFICGGKGRTSRKTPNEIKALGQKLSLNTQSLIYASKMAAKVDNNALQDGYQLYHHNFFFTRSGKWSVVQQGMKPSTSASQGWARRYHWLSDNLEDFVCEPQKAIACDHQGQVLNLIAKESNLARITTASLSRRQAEKNIKEMKKLKNLKLDRHHQILVSDINPKNIKKILLSTYEHQPENFEKLLGMKGVGPKTIRALSLIAELLYGTPTSTRDPAKYSFAHGGKDGTPYPVDKKTYQESTEYLRRAINRAKLGHYEKLHALRRLPSQN